LLHPDETSPQRVHKVLKFQGHILVAEDNEANQELIKILLTKYGLTYDLAINGLEAVRLYKQNRYDLVLMDEQMPIMDGNRAVQEILKYERENELRHTPISALTANVIKGARERGLMSGFDSFLGKPIVLKELERVFSHYLKASKQNHAHPKTVVQSGGIQGLDTHKLAEELMLSQSELMMLADLFIKKMSKQIPQMQEAIAMRDYKNIALIAHSIKGSSGNFRLEEVQEESAKIEKMAKAADANFNYEEAFEYIRERLLAIKIE